MLAHFENTNKTGIGTGLRLLCWDTYSIPSFKEYSKVKKRLEVHTSWASHKDPVVSRNINKDSNMDNNVPQTQHSERRPNIMQTNGKERPFLALEMLPCQQTTVPALTSTLNGCSSPFTAHKIHSNNCKHNVPIQQLWRHLLLRAANKTIVNPAAVASCLWTLVFTVGAGKRTGTNPTRLAATSPLARGLSCGAESRREEREQGEGAGFVDRSRRCLRRGLRRRLSPGKDSLLAPVSSLPVLQSPGESSGTPAVVPSGRVLLVFCTARHSSPFSIVFPTECACAHWHERPHPTRDPSAPIKQSTQPWRFLFELVFMSLRLAVLSAVGEQQPTFSCK